MTCNEICKKQFKRPNPIKDPRSPAKESKPDTPLFANLPGFDPVSVGITPLYMIQKVAVV